MVSLRLGAYQIHVLGEAYDQTAIQPAHRLLAEGGEAPKVE